MSTLTAALVAVIAASAVPKLPGTNDTIVPVETIVSFARHENPQLDPAAVNRNQNGTVDVGLMQINSANFAQLGLTMETAKDPAKSIRAAASLMLRDYASCVATLSGDAAIDCMTSKYNTGTGTHGFANGYVVGYRSVQASAPDPTSDHAIHEPSPGRTWFVNDAISFHHIPSKETSK